MDNLTETFRNEVLDFIKAHGFSDRGFSELCGLSVNFVLRLRRGNGPRSTTIDRVRLAMAKYKTDKTEAAE